MLCLSGFELFSRWVSLTLVLILVFMATYLPSWDAPNERCLHWLTDGVREATIITIFHMCLLKERETRRKQGITNTFQCISAPLIYWWLLRNRKLLHGHLFSLFPREHWSSWSSDFYINSFSFHLWTKTLNILLWHRHQISL